MNDKKSSEKISSEEQVMSNKKKKYIRVLVSLDEELVQQIRVNLKELLKDSRFFRVSVPLFLGRVIRENWKEELKFLHKAVKKMED